MENNLKFQTLKLRSDFNTLFKKGKRSRPNSWMILNYQSNDLGLMRCGWTVPRFVGKAVLRNKIKRWCREYVRDLKETKNCDINFVFKRKDKDFYKNINFQQFKQAMDSGFKRIS